MLDATATLMMQAILGIQLASYQPDVGNRATVIWEELTCIAQNIWFEARGSSPEDQLAVANVVMNRVASDAYPDDICAVIWQFKQFSWTDDGRSDVVRLENGIETDAWQAIVDLSVEVLEGRAPDITGGATHYHHHAIDPAWNSAMALMARHGDHVYYKIVARPEPRPDAI
ncbi:MAG: cell wall hydrolase [Geminicoccaceae bacterium]